MKRTLILGGPGAGKTERLMKVMEGALGAGIHPKRIALCAFTNAATNVAKARAKDRFGYEDEDLPYFRTLHSLCFRETGLMGSNVVKKEHLLKLAKITGELQGNINDWQDDQPFQNIEADPFMTVDHFARTSMMTLREGWLAHGRGTDWTRLLRFSKAYQKFKDDNMLLDFTDMLLKFNGEGSPVPVDIAIVDEGQDLTKLQWAVIERAFAQSQELWVAGDDDQSCYKWAGAAEDYLLSLDWEREVLEKSHRLPRAIFDLSQKIAHRIKTRFAKVQQADDRQGAVKWLPQLKGIDLHQGKWLLMARTGRQLIPFIDYCHDNGVAYTSQKGPSVDPVHIKAIAAYERWRAGEQLDGPDTDLVLSQFKRFAGKRKPKIVLEDHYTADAFKLDISKPWFDSMDGITENTRKYYQVCRRAGERLNDEQRILTRVRIQTFHSAKGMEADSVIMFTDLTPKTWEGYQKDQDGEHRVFYVGVTRASNTLYLMTPQSNYNYAIPR